MAFEEGAGEGVAGGVARLGEAGEVRATGEGETEGGGDFVVRFAERVVDGAAEESDVGPGGEAVERGVAAGEDSAGGGEFEVGDVGIEKAGIQMGLDVIDGDERFLPGPGEGFCGGDADEE